MKCAAVVVAGFVFALGSFAWADSGNDSKGTTAAAFLKLGAGARAVAMGEAFTAVADDATALYWNPAGLTRVKMNAVSLTHADYLDSSGFDHAAIAHRTDNGSAMGVGLQYFSAGKVTETDTNGNATGSLRPSDLALALGYAKAVMGFSVGLSAKYVQSKIVESAGTGTLDIGVLSPTIATKWRFGLAALNVGGKLKFDDKNENLPTVFKIGGAYNATQNWITSLDIGIPRDNDPVAALGTEYRMPLAHDWAVAGRAGFNSTTSNDIGGLTGVSFGLGITQCNITFDYGLLPFGDLGLTHRFSLGYTF